MDFSVQYVVQPLDHALDTVTIASQKDEENRHFWVLGTKNFGRGLKHLNITRASM